MKRKYMKKILIVPLAIAVVLLFFLALEKHPDVIRVSSNASGKELPIYCVQTEEPKIAISFDAAWGNEDTPQILEILAKHNVKATFFMTGGWVESYPEDVKAILAAGHDLGNHSETHPNMSELSAEEITTELMTVHNRVKELTGYEMTLFRPPYGDYDNEVITTAKECGYYTIQWSVDSLDWKDYGVDQVISQVCDNEHLDNGAIILCHNGAKYTAQALDEMLTNLEGQGYQFVPISGLIVKDNYTIDVTGKQIPASE
ncbi:MAG: polysaccharide deacetylase family protein [Eubacterium sp.]|nr:polysaccharide deacetylase family protein [Eubacterium sp.]